MVHVVKSDYGSYCVHLSELEDDEVSMNLFETGCRGNVEVSGRGRRNRERPARF